MSVNTNINSQLLSTRCAELLERLGDGNLTPNEQTEAAPLFAERIRRLANTCQAGFEGKLQSGKWRLADEEFATFDDIPKLGERG